VGERTVTDITLMDLRLPGTNGTDESDSIRHGKDPALSERRGRPHRASVLTGERLDVPRRSDQG
jgi:hypothetical protein